MRVGIVGAGPIGRATAAFLAHDGHGAAIWSPSGKSLEGLAADPDRRDHLLLRYEGALEGRVSVARIASAAALADFPVVLIALPGHAYAAVLPALVDALLPQQLVIVSGALSLVPLWIRSRMKARGVVPCVVAAWGTTLGTARRSASADVYLNTLRTRFDMAAVPASAAASALETCRTLFGDRFVPADDVLAVALANVNPVAHAAEVLPNLSRIDRQEEWPLFHCLSASGARICAALDAERIAIAGAFGKRVRSIEEHYRLSYHVDGTDIAAIAEAIHHKYPDPPGPKTLEHRYILEDVPYGLVVYEALARVAGMDVPHTGAAITLLSTACGRDFRADNPLLAELSLTGTPADLVEHCRVG